MDGNGESLFLEKTETGYNLFFRSNKIDAGTYKTSYILLGKTDTKTTQAGEHVALVLKTQ